MDLFSGYKYRWPYTRFRREGEQRGAVLRQLSLEKLLSLAHTPTDTLRFEWSTGTISFIMEERQ
jgi:hypothetical protein